jgi:DNA-binding NarL/FixJ family response regulator
VLRVFIHDVSPNVISSWQAALKKYSIIEQVHYAFHPSESFVKIRKIQIDLIFWGVTRRSGLEHDLFEQMLIDKPMRPVVGLVDLVKFDLAKKMLEEGACAVVPRINSDDTYQLFLNGVFQLLPDLNPQHHELNQPEFSYLQNEFYRDLAWGLENSELCHRYQIAYETVRSHIKTLGRHMHTKGREQLVAAGFRNKVLH